MENFGRSNSDIFSMEIDEHAKSTLLEMARWTKFLAIMGFIGLGFTLLFGVIIAVVLSMSPVYGAQLGALGNMGAAGIIILYVVIGGIMFYPVYALLKYSTSMKRAMRTNSKNDFNAAITYLKNVFKYHGIIVIALLALYGIVIIIGIFAAMANR